MSDADPHLGEEHDPKSWGLAGLAWIAVVVVLLWGTSWIAIMHSGLNWSERGAYGDMFGSVNSLFSGLAFAGVIYTILLQRHQLALQQREMRHASEEARRLAESSEDSVRLSALNLLVAHYGELLKVHAKESLREVPNSTAPGGMRVEIVDPEANEHLMLVFQKYTQCFNDLERIYERLSGHQGLGSARYGPSSGETQG